MNIVNNGLLKLALLPSPIYRKMGVNTDHLKVILNAKLLMDDRRPNSFQQVQRKKSNKPVSTATLGTMFLSALMGLVFLVSFLVGKSYETKFTFYFSFYVTILASILIADFTSVLIDIRDNFIILPKPVNDATFVVSRLLHIFIHVCKMVIPMIIPCMVYLIINVSIVAIVPFLFIVLMATLFTIFLINACYILILKLTTPAKFQSIISYIQIVFAVVFYASYQLVPRLINTTALNKYEISNFKGIMFLPTFWFGGAWQQLYSWDGDLRAWFCLALTIIIPLLSIWIVIKYFAPSFNQKLSMITGSTGEVSTANKKRRDNKSSAYSKFLSRLFTKSGAERNAFLFSWKMMIRSRSFKMKVYPAIGYMIVIVIVFMIRGNSLSFTDIIQQTDTGIITSLIIIYFSNLLLLSAITQITVYEKYKAAWIFFTTPIDKPGAIISGSIKAAVAQFFFPVAFGIAIFLISLAGVSIIPNLLFGMANELVIISISAYLNFDKLPFSSPQQPNASGGRTLRVFGVMILGLVIAIAHRMVYHITIVVIILTVLSLAAAWLVLNSMQNKTWLKVYSTYSDE